MLFGVFGLQRGPKWMPKWLRKPWKSCPGSRHGEETRKRTILATFLYDFVSIFHIFLCCVFYSFWWHWQRSRKAAISNPDRKTHGSASKITFSQMWSRQKKSHKMVKKTYKKRSWKQDSEKRAFGINFPSILDSKTIQNEVPGPSKNRPGNGLKKRSKKMRTLPFYGHFWGGSGGAGDTHFSSIFQPSAALGTKMAPGAPPGAPRGHPGLVFLWFCFFFLWFFLMHLP